MFITFGKWEIRVHEKSAPTKAPFKILRTGTSNEDDHSNWLPNRVSCSLNSIIIRERDDTQIRTGAHDLSQNTRVPRSVPPCADVAGTKEKYA